MYETPSIYDEFFRRLDLSESPVTRLFCKLGLIFVLIIFTLIYLVLFMLTLQHSYNCMMIMNSIEFEYEQNYFLYFFGYLHSFKAQFGCFWAFLLTKTDDKFEGHFYDCSSRDVERLPKFKVYDAEKRKKKGKEEVGSIDEAIRYLETQKFLKRKYHSLN